MSEQCVPFLDMLLSAPEMLTAHMAETHRSHWQRGCESKSAMVVEAAAGGNMLTSMLMCYVTTALMAEACVSIAMLGSCAGKRLSIFIIITVF